MSYVLRESEGAGGQMLILSACLKTKIQLSNFVRGIYLAEVEHKISQ